MVKLSFGEESLIPTEQEFRTASGLICTLWQREFFLPLPTTEDLISSSKGKVVPGLH
jgi:hypothetical protein